MVWGGGNDFEGGIMDGHDHLRLFVKLVFGSHSGFKAVHYKAGCDVDAMSDSFNAPSYKWI